MTNILRSGAAGLAFLALAAAGPGATAEVTGRYTMSPTDGGFVRLDTQTGAMALCTRKETDWACADMPESADSSRKRLDGLEAENKQLKDEIKRLEETTGLPGSGLGPSVPGEPPKPFALPDEKDVDKAFDYIESMIKKFRERAKRLEDKEGGGGDGTPL